MLWKKPADLKYTDLCIFIDENVPKILKPGENKELEDTIYNYLWLLVKALAIKKCMFQEFQEYDSYAFYAATRLFFALRKNQINQGKTIKGKEIRPIKSCLNYTKKLLYPMKIEYQRENYLEVISEDFVSKKFDAFSMKEQMKADARAEQGVGDAFRQYLNSSLSSAICVLDKVLTKSPFAKDSLDYKRVKISILLNCLQSLKVKHSLDSDMQTIILWKLPKTMSSYIRVLIKEFYSALKVEIMDCYSAADIDEDLIERILSQPVDEKRLQDED